MNHFPGPFEPIFKDCSNPGPVPLERLNLTFTTHSPLLSLPIEILNIIVNYLPQHGLEGFALANSDCRQIARSRQFCKVVLKYNDRDLNLLKHLIEEHEACTALPGDTSSRSTSIIPIGRYIRAVVFGNQNEHYQRHLRYLLASTELSEDEPPIISRGAVIGRRAFEKIKDSQRGYVDQVAKICNTHGLLPNLDLLDLALVPGDETLPLWQSITHSSLRYLRLPNYVPPGDDLTTSSDAIQCFHCPNLQRLEIPAYRHKRSWSSLTMEVMNHFASSLESLACLRKDEDRPAADSAGGIMLPLLANMRRASFNSDATDSSLLRVVIASVKLTTLDLSCNQELPIEILNNHGEVPTLRHFTTSGSMIESLLPFVSQNKQLTKLQLNHPLSDRFLSGSLLPLLTQSFHSLACLALVWSESTISEHGIQLLSQIHSLSRLYLSAGAGDILRPTFLVDHPLLRSHLSQLPKLRELFFHHDTYDNGYVWSLPGDYYTHLRWNQTGRLDYAFQPADDRFEIVHERNMTEVAEDYGSAIPSLEWIFVGQLPFAFRVGGGVRRPRVLSDRRIELNKEQIARKVVDRMFGSFDPTFGS